MVTTNPPQKKLLPLAIEEIFQTVQGEGAFSGLPVSFVRLYGCPVGCNFCDQGWAAQHDKTRENTFSKMSVDSIVEQLKAHSQAHVVISGGEPLEQPGCIDLIAALKDAGKIAHIETAGFSCVPTSLLLDVGYRWITLSPKDKVARSLKHASSNEFWRVADEIKIVIEDGSELDYYEKRFRLLRPGVCVFLQPEWNNLAESTAIAHSLLQKYKAKHPAIDFRLGLQAHKFWNLP